MKKESKLIKAGYYVFTKHEVETGYLAVAPLIGATVYNAVPFLNKISPYVSNLEVIVDKISPL